MIGYTYSPHVKITAYGIDFVEKVFDRFTRNLENENIDNQSKSKVIELLKEDHNTSTKMQKIVDLAQKYTNLWLNIMEIVGSLFGNR
jgi:hypothetical protein